MLSSLRLNHPLADTRASEQTVVCAAETVIIPVRCYAAILAVATQSLSNYGVCRKSAASCPIVARSEAQAENAFCVFRVEIRIFNDFYLFYAKQKKSKILSFSRSNV